MINRKEIKPSDIWNKEKIKALGEFISQQSQQQTPEQKFHNELLGIQFRIEDYIDGDITSEKLRVGDFVKLYLKVLNISQKQLAILFEIEPSNLHKYLVGERKLNTAMVLKLSAFSHLSPELWLRIETKNELIEIQKEREQNKDYQKYDYRKLLAIAGS